MRYRRKRYIGPGLSIITGVVVWALVIQGTLGTHHAAAVTIQNRTQPAGNRILIAQEETVEGIATADDPLSPTNALPVDVDASRTVKEGDIYTLTERNLLVMILPGGIVQLIDLSDLANPKLLSRVEIPGDPVELYVVGARAFVLLNDSQRYDGAGGEQSTVLVLSIADPADPQIVDRAFIPGFVHSSRLVHDTDGTASLYVVNGIRAEPQTNGAVDRSDGDTFVASFDVAPRSLEMRSELTLAGRPTAIHVDADTLLVACSRAHKNTAVSLIDISDSTGIMALGDSVEVGGAVRSPFGLDIANDILRVFSGNPSIAGFRSSATNHLQTWVIESTGELSSADECEFGEGESLHGTVFVGNHGYASTSLVTDPFHAFALSDDGTCREVASFELSGRNDYFQAAAADSRLIGIGMNTDGGMSVAVRLFEVTDERNSSPLLAIAVTEEDYSWTSSDYRAFSVLENAVAVEGPDRIVETGLVILPIAGFDTDTAGWSFSAQMFTFSDATVTPRGVIPHRTPVRRSFEIEDEFVAILSDEQLSTYFVGEPDDPLVIGVLEWGSPLPAPGSCSVDSDCPEGSSCVFGTCVSDNAPIPSICNSDEDCPPSLSCTFGFCLPL